MRFESRVRLERLGDSRAPFMAMFAFALLVAGQGGCMGYLAAAVTPPGNWEVDDIDMTRISEIVVGETTRQQIEAKFGVPNLNIRYAEGRFSESFRKLYRYRVERTRFAGDIVWGIKTKSEGKTLLTVMFDENDVVSYVSGPELGAVELLKEHSDPKDLAR